MNRFSRFAKLYKRYQRKIHLRQRRYFGYAPYSLSLYESLLIEAQKSQQVTVQPYLFQPNTPSETANLFIRHDVDTASCMANLRTMTKINEALNIQSGIYFRVDGEEYSIAQHRAEIEALRDTGFEVGLHTVCYLEDDYFAELARETEKFVQEAGFRPRSFTVHGLGTRRIQTRQRFYEEVSTRLQDFGYQFSDCCRNMRRYDYVIEDCHFDNQAEKRFIYDDFSSLPTWFRSGADYLMLTHPCYWEA